MAQSSPHVASSQSIPNFSELAEKLQTTAQALLAFSSPAVTEPDDELPAAEEKTPSELRTFHISGFMVDEEKEIAVQVNGKVRATILVHINDTDDIIQEKALNEDNVKKHIDGKEIVKEVIVPKKLVSIVVK